MSYVDPGSRARVSSGLCVVFLSAAAVELSASNLHCATLLSKNRQTKRATCQEKGESAKWAKATRPPELTCPGYLSRFYCSRGVIFYHSIKKNYDLCCCQATMLTKFETKSARVKGKSLPAAVSIGANVS